MYLQNDFAHSFPLQIKTALCVLGKWSVVINVLDWKSAVKLASQKLFIQFTLSRERRKEGDTFFCLIWLCFYLFIFLISLYLSILLNPYRIQSSVTVVIYFRGQNAPDCKLLFADLFLKFRFFFFVCCLQCIYYSNLL